MSSSMRKLPGLTLSVLLFAGAALAQTSAIEGTVKGADGQPVKDALVKIDRTDIKGHYEVKTKKKGDYFHAGLPLGTYKITVAIDGKDVDTVDKVRTRLGDPVTINFDLHQQAERAAANAKAMETGQLTKEQERDMSPEAKAALEKQVKQRSAEMQKNKALNDAFNTGMEGLKNKQYEAAVQSLTKAAEMDPKQHVIWGNLAEAYSELAKTKTGAEQQAALDKALETYPKAIELLPTDASYHNNYALALARAKKFDQMQEELNKAVSIDQANAGRYYYNMGAVLTNAGQSGPACDAFKKAIDTDPNYADAFYQYGICLTSKATNTADGKIIFPPGTDAAFQKYLELKPDGPNAEAAKGMLATMGSKVETVYRNPNAPKGKAPATSPKKK
jgi:Tfp pilus assembly protein PilF